MVVLLIPIADWDSGFLVRYWGTSIAPASVNHRRARLFLAFLLLEEILKCGGHRKEQLKILLFVQIGHDIDRVLVGFKRGTI